MLKSQRKKLPLKKPLVDPKEIALTQRMTEIVEDPTNKNQTKILSFMILMEPLVTKVF